MAFLERFIATSAVKYEVKSKRQSERLIMMIFMYGDILCRLAGKI